jgi:hypothetical protein
MLPVKETQFLTVVRDEEAIEHRLYFNLGNKYLSPCLDMKQMILKHLKIPAQVSQNKLTFLIAGCKAVI